MQILTAAQVAKLVEAEPTTIEQLFREGIAPGCKLGRGWVTTDVDFFNFVSAKCKANTEPKKCHSTNAVKSGGRNTQLTDNYLESLLVSEKKDPHKKFTRNLKVVS